MTAGSLKGYCRCHRNVCIAGWPLRSNRKATRDREIQIRSIITRVSDRNRYPSSCSSPYPYMSETVPTRAHIAERKRENYIVNWCRLDLFQALSSTHGLIKKRASIVPLFIFWCLLFPSFPPFLSLSLCFLTSNCISDDISRHNGGFARKWAILSASSWKIFSRNLKQVIEVDWFSRFILRFMYEIWNLPCYVSCKEIFCSAYASI